MGFSRDDSFEILQKIKNIPLITRGIMNIITEYRIDIKSNNL
jgi:hypothetical protein